MKMKSGQKCHWLWLRTWYIILAWCWNFHTSSIIWSVIAASENKLSPFLCGLDRVWNMRVWWALSIRLISMDDKGENVLQLSLLPIIKRAPKVALRGTPVNSLPLDIAWRVASRVNVCSFFCTKAFDPIRYPQMSI